MSGHHFVCSCVFFLEKSVSRKEPESLQAAMGKEKKTRSPEFGLELTSLKEDMWSLVLFVIAALMGVALSFRATGI